MKGKKRSETLFVETKKNQNKYLVQILLSSIDKWIETMLCIFWINEISAEMYAIYFKAFHFLCSVHNPIRWRWKMTTRYIFYLYVYSHGMKNDKKPEKIFFYIFFLCCINFKQTPCNVMPSFSSLLSSYSHHVAYKLSTCALHHRSQVVWICINIISFGGNICSFSLSYKFAHCKWRQVNFAHGNIIACERDVMVKSANENGHKDRTRESGRANV